MYSPLAFVVAQFPPMPLTGLAQTWSPSIAAPPTSLVTLPLMPPPSTIFALISGWVLPASTDTGSASEKLDLPL